MSDKLSDELIEVIKHRLPTEKPEIFDATQPIPFQPRIEKYRRQGYNQAIQETRKALFGE